MNDIESLHLKQEYESLQNNYKDIDRQRLENDQMVTSFVYNRFIDYFYKNLVKKMVWQSNTLGTFICMNTDQELQSILGWCYDLVCLKETQLVIHKDISVYTGLQPQIICSTLESFISFYKYIGVKTIEGTVHRLNKFVDDTKKHIEALNQIQNTTYE